VLNTVANVELYDSIAVAAQSKGCSGGTETIYAVSMYNDNATDAVTYTAGYTPGGTNTSLLYSTGFSFATNNMFGTNPNFANPIIPSSPSCGSYTNAPGCMAKIVSDFTPTTAAVAAFGYQAPGTTPVNNPLYPQWLCNVALPTGLVTPGCATSAQ
jgi:hypothetical protein